MSQSQSQSQSQIAGKYLPPSSVPSKDDISIQAGEFGENRPKSFKIKISREASSLAGSDHEDSVNSTVKASKSSKSSKAPKKRKAGDEATGTNSKKGPTKISGSADTTKKDKKVKKTEVRPKGPVDVEKQCGVPLPQGGMCARSLTCKSHSMGSKRAVTGRSQPYDILLAQYQKKNHAKLSMKAAADQGQGTYDDGAPPADSDEEVAAVMEAVKRSTSRGPSMKALMPIRRRHKFLRMREMMSTALRPGVQASQIQAHGKVISFTLSRQTF